MNPLLEKEVAEVPLKNGGVALIDAADLEIVSGYNWRQRPVNERKGDHSAYVYTVVREPAPARGVRGKLKYIYMHRLILGLTDPKVLVDHRNHNGLDNRRENIWACTHKENSANRRDKKVPNQTQP